jgi:quercetin dioxygenase-like cupin family protein
MKADLLLEQLEFHNDNPYAQPLLVSPQSRILRFMLKPGQRIAEHAAPHSPFHVVILQGTGMFSGSDGVEHSFGPNTLLTFDVGETHSVRALDEPLVFLGFLQGVDPYRSTSMESGGVLGSGPKPD